MLSNDDCIANVKTGVSSNDSNAHEKDGVLDDVNPEDSVSNVGSKCSSQRSGNSCKSSTTSSARIKAEAERASLMARVAALKTKHALEEKEQNLRRNKEQLKLETVFAVSTAKLAVLQASDQKSSSQAFSNGMNSYLKREKEKGNQSGS